MGGSEPLWVLKHLWCRSNCTASCRRPPPWWTRCGSWTSTSQSCVAPARWTSCPVWRPPCSPLRARVRALTRVHTSIAVRIEPQLHQAIAKSARSLCAHWALVRRNRPHPGHYVTVGFAAGGGVHPLGGITSVEPKFFFHGVLHQKRYVFYLALQNFLGAVALQFFLCFSGCFVEKKTAKRF